MGFFSRIFKRKPEKEVIKDKVIADKKYAIKKQVAPLPDDVVDDKLFRCAVRLRDLLIKKDKKGRLSSADNRMVVAYKRTIYTYDHPSPKNLNEAEKLVTYLEVR